MFCYCGKKKRIAKSVLFVSILSVLVHFNMLTTHDANCSETFCWLSTFEPIYSTRVFWHKCHCLRKCSRGWKWGLADFDETFSRSWPYWDIPKPKLVLFSDMDFSEMDFYLYADDTQLYTTFSCDDKDALTPTISRIESCLVDITNWMTTNELKLNTDKTKLLILYSRFRL